MTIALSRATAVICCTGPFWTGAEVFKGFHGSLSFGNTDGIAPPVADFLFSHFGTSATLSLVLDFTHI
jgi:hypothetical protein